MESTGVSNNHVPYRKVRCVSDLLKALEVAEASRKVRVIVVELISSGSSSDFIDCDAKVSHFKVVHFVHTAFYCAAFHVDGVSVPALETVRVPLNT